VKSLSSNLEDDVVNLEDDEGDEEDEEEDDLFGEDNMEDDEEDELHGQHDPTVTTFSSTTEAPPSNIQPGKVSPTSLDVQQSMTKEEELEKKGGDYDIESPAPSPVEEEDFKYGSDMKTTDDPRRFSESTLEASTHTAVPGSGEGDTVTSTATAEHAMVLHSDVFDI